MCCEPNSFSLLKIATPSRYLIDVKRRGCPIRLRGRKTNGAGARRSGAANPQAQGGRTVHLQKTTNAVRQTVPKWTLQLPSPVVIVPFAETSQHGP